MTAVRFDLLIGAVLLIAVGKLIGDGDTTFAIGMFAFALFVLAPIWRLGGRRAEVAEGPVEAADGDEGDGGAREAAWSNGGRSVPHRGSERS
jgi:hypothetical protein